jgi:CRISPR-associated protein Cas1
VAGKIQNCRNVLMRGARQAKDEVAADALRQAAQALADALRGLARPDTVGVDGVRGREGEAGQAYFHAFNYLVLVHEEEFRFEGRNRRPPRDRMNALLSFIYALLQIDCVAAAEGVGLDPQVGFLHAIRPGRPALALDLMEELRPAVADRLALTLVNRRQLTPAHFEERPGGAVLLNDEGRRAVLIAYQRRKQEEVHHAVIERSLPVGLIPHVQARLLARHLRGDLEYYLPYVSQ